MSPNLAGLRWRQHDRSRFIPRICGHSRPISRRSLITGTNEVVVLRMPFQPAADERAERTNVEASRSRVVERISCDLRAHSLTFVPLGYLSVKKNDGVGCELVFRYTGERAVNPGLEAGVCWIVDNRHTHLAHCARGPRRTRSGQAVDCRLLRRAIVVHGFLTGDTQGHLGDREPDDTSPWYRHVPLRWAYFLRLVPLHVCGYRFEVVGMSGGLYD